jgi:COMPASS component SWD3
MSDAPTNVAKVTASPLEVDGTAPAAGSQRKKSATVTHTDPANGQSTGKPRKASTVRKSGSETNIPNASSQSTSPSLPIDTSNAQWSHVGFHRTTIPPQATFDESNEQIRRDLLRMIVQYLQHEGFAMSSATIQDEANVKLLEKQQDKDALRRMTKAIHEGDWDLVAKLIHKHLKKFHSQQGFLYAVCKQEYLELIDRQEYQKAFTFLTTHLKPLEKISTMTNRNEFKDLCYLLTCKAVGEVEAFRDWEGVARSREKLVEQLQSTFELDVLVSAAAGPGSISSSHANGDHSGSGGGADAMPEHRLLHLLHQSVAYQMEFSRYHPKTVPKVTTLLQDFECDVLPNCVKSTYRGHSQNVKFVQFVGHDGEFLASGSSDATIRLWPVEFPMDPLSTTSAMRSVTTGDVCRTWSRELKGHSSRIWYMTSNAAGDRLFSASGDGTVKIWDIRHALTDLSQEMHHYARDEDEDEGAAATAASRFTSSSPAMETTDSNQTMATPGSDCIATLGSGGDVYTVNLHPSETHLVTGGYDQTVRLYDIHTGANVKTFRGHNASVCDAQFNRYANLIASGSKDGTIRLWDILSGLCVHTLRQTLGEVTSISLASNGYVLLSGSRNNSNRLWDMRMLSAPRAQLSTGAGGSGGGASSGGGGGSSNAYGFGSSGSLRNLSVPSLEHKPIQRFKGHQNTAKNIVRASFGPRDAFVLGGSEDGAVYVWDVATGKLLEKLAGHEGVTYNAKWHERQALMASSSHDGTVRTWWWQDMKR